MYVIEAKNKSNGDVFYIFLAPNLLEAWDLANAYSMDGRFQYSVVSMDALPRYLLPSEVEWDRSDWEDTLQRMSPRT